MNDIFKKRRSIYYTQNLKYLRYVFNDHFVLFILLAIGVLAVQYARFLQQDQLNTTEKIVVLIVVSTVSLLIGKLATFIEEADAVFLLAKEEEIKKELQLAIRRSLILPVVVSVTLVVISIPALQFPIYIDLIWLMLLIVIKGILFTFKVNRFSPKGNLEWSALTKYEDNRQARLLKIYAMFTNVKGLTTGAKRRKYLDFLLPRHASGVYSYLYSRTYLRTGDYFGLTLRLLLIALIGIIFIPSFVTILIFITVINYLLLFQFLALREAYIYQPLLKVYPTVSSLAYRALKRLVLNIIGAVVFIETCALLIVNIDQLGYVLIFTIMTLILSFIYVNYRLKIKK